MQAHGLEGDGLPDLGDVVGLHGGDAGGASGGADRRAAADLAAAEAGARGKYGRTLFITVSHTTRHTSLIFRTAYAHNILQKNSLASDFYPEPPHRRILLARARAYQATVRRSSLRNWSDQTAAARARRRRAAW